MMLGDSTEAGNVRSSIRSSNDGSQQSEQRPSDGMIDFLKQKQQEIVREGAKLRQKFTEGQLWLVILVVTLPMVIIQVVALIWFPPDRTLVLNSEESVGRCKCRSMLVAFASCGHRLTMFVQTSAGHHRELRISSSRLRVLYLLPSCWTFAKYRVPNRSQLSSTRPRRSRTVWFFPSFSPQLDLPSFLQPVIRRPVRICAI